MNTAIVPVENTNVKKRSRISRFRGFLTGTFCFMMLFSFSKSVGPDFYKALEAVRTHSIVNINYDYKVPIDTSTIHLN